MKRATMIAVTLMALPANGFAQEDQALIDEGRRLFAEETFEGNGRTCTTCHPLD